MKPYHIIYIVLLLFLVLFSCNDKDDPINPPVDPPEETSGYPDGITRISDDSLAFVLFAPKKGTVHLIGDFNDWIVSGSSEMEKGDDDRFRIKIGGLDKDKEYICQYLIDDKIRIADPYANKISDPNYDKSISSAIYPNLISYPAGKTSEIAMVVSTKQDNYNWKVTNFSAPDQHNLVIYEILIRDFTEQRSIKAIEAKLPYLKALGVNAIELMPFNEFEGNNSWGYNPSFYFATDKAYGTSNDYKDFIDACHQNGMAVIMDMVLNHSYGQSPMVRMYQKSDGNPSADNPWYNTTSPNTTYSWGYDFDHESIYTQQFVDSVCAFWMKEYKIDGFRLDFTKGFTNTSGDGHAFDQSRINILTRMADQIWKRNRKAIIILEHLTENREETELANYGMMLWGNLNYNTNEATMGWGEELENGSYKGDLSWASYKQRGWSQPNLVAYMESHDEERIMFKNNRWGKEYNGYDVTNLATGLQRTKAAAVIFFSIPGPKMMWQFGEMGYDVELNDDRLAIKPTHWEYLDVPARKELHDVFATMINYHINDAAFSTTNYTIDLTKHFKVVSLKSSYTPFIAMANFDVVPQTKSIDFGTAGTWQDLFTESTITTTSSTHSITLEPGEYRLYFFK